jgi:hypothetical protein
MPIVAAYTDTVALVHASGANARIAYVDNG